MGKFIDLVGQTFGRVKVLRAIETLWEYECICGNIGKATTGDLNSGKTRSCGCFHKERASEANMTHGLSNSTIYVNYHGMIQKDLKGARMKDYGVKEILSNIKDGGIGFRSLEEELWSEIPGFIPTGSPALDYAIGGYQKGYRGGIPIGRATEIWGPESTGKSTLLDNIIKNFLNEMDGIFILADKEHAHEERRMLEIGVDPTNLVFMEKLVKEDAKNPEDYTLEDFFSMGKKAFQALRKTYPDVPIAIALDSLGAIDTAMQQTVDTNMRTRLDKAAVMTDLFPNFCSFITEVGGTVILVNQMRTKPGVSFGDPTYSPGGDLKNFMFSLRIKVEREAIIKADADPNRKGDGPDDIGIITRFKINKNKIAPPFRKGKFALLFDDRGIYYPYGLALMIEDRKVWERDNCKLEKTANTWSWDGEVLGRSFKGMVKTLADNEELMYEIETELFGSTLEEKEEIVEVREKVKKK
jgi:recombination protein RecA